ncbi:DUF2637 domain-containing protein [Streptomyces sp. H10-C2]|uniref:DUF2637 domain-containing protein n=1 Tax=unclassified Streptomyces TaxID=2593676 RepID=UPI0024BA4AA3|nr:MULTISPECIES: DUF2637 domain-containing protein [unclassified Streptomyces]MDJ0341374.1 DUF2637 domain-containing protein [Streptomyces sp. PH10-H1]MDJ0370969.1 DUF2637 domain-containing protein [Streptomyces sp. H10-C2]
MNRTPKALLILALVGVVGMAFRVSWNAQRDVAATVGADAAASLLYPFVVDGLMALALVATLVLTGRDRRFALRVLAGYTAASLVLNYVHGLVPALHNGGSRMVLAEWAPANWALVLLATSLPVGSIFFGSDLVAKVLHHQPANQDETAVTLTNQSVSDLQESTPPAVPEPPVHPAIEAAEAAPILAPVGQLAAAVVQGPRRATGRVPQAARTPRPIRTPEELLAEGREVTAAWSDDALTAEAIRKELRTAPAKARIVRDALKAERGIADAA